MGLINWIFDIYQHSRIDEVQQEAAQARAEISRLRRGSEGVDVARLERLLGELALATKTMQRLLVEKGVCQADELARRLREIDLEDGVDDGRSRLD